MISFRSDANEEAGSSFEVSTGGSKHKQPKEKGSRKRKQSGSHGSSSKKNRAAVDYQV